MDHSEDKLFLSRVHELADRAENGGYITFSDFLDDHKQSLLSQSVGRLSVCLETYGGYEGAERVVIVFYPDYLSEMREEAKDEAIALLKITLADKRFLKRIPEHRDYLGAIMGTGIRREKVGDVLLDDEGAYVFVVRDMVDYLKQEMTSVGAAVVSVREVPKSEAPKREGGKESVVSVASLRLDAFVAHGFRMGRNEAVKVIRGGAVLRNGAMLQDPDKTIAVGDKITLRGKGRIILLEDLGISRSGRHQVRIERFGK